MTRVMPKRAVSNGNRWLEVANIDNSLAVLHARLGTGEVSGSAADALRNPTFVRATPLGRPSEGAARWRPSSPGSTSTTQGASSLWCTGSGEAGVASGTNR